MLMQKYSLSGFPSLLFIDGNGKVIGQTGGYHKPKELLEVGTRIINQK
jgi:thioredoxin-related protein